MSAFSQQPNNSPLKAFQDQYNLSPVPFSAANDMLVPGAMIYRSGMNTTVPLVPDAAKSLHVSLSNKYQPKITVKKEDTKSFFGAFSGLGGGVNLHTTNNVDISEADIVCKNISDSDAKKLIENNPQVGAEYRAEGGRKNHFMYIASMFCYATDLTLSSDSSRDVLAGLGTVPTKCEEQPAADSTTTTVADLISDPLKKAVSSIKGSGGWCTKENNILAIKAKEPFPVGMSLFGMSGKGGMPWNQCVPSAESTNRLCASPWRDIYIK
jgi:hypothetical protein